jgi:hypothetical protein
MPAHVNLAEYIERRKADSTVVELDDGVTISIPPAELFSDEVFAALDAGDHKGAACAVLGDEQYALFVAAGGNWRLLNSILREQQAT